MPPATSSLDRWRRWRPFGIAKRVLSFAVTIVAVSSVLAIDAGAHGEGLPTSAVTAAAVEPVRELVPAVEAAERPTPAARPLGSEYVALAAADPEAVEARRSAYQEQVEAQEAANARRALWFRLADCESGFRNGGTPIAGSARWDYGLSPGEGAPFEGGLQFAPSTWDAFRDADMPDHAGHASPGQQIVVAERVLAAQGWRAWPVCSRMLGLRG